MHVVAVLWDFDKTLINGYMQEPLFRRFGVDPVSFWDEVNALADFHRTEANQSCYATESLYLNHILTYVRHGIFPNLSNETLRELGKAQNFALGMPEFFPHLDSAIAHLPAVRDKHVAVEHYVLTTGLRQIVLGSAVAPFLRHVWGCEFLDCEAPPGFLKDGAKRPASGPIADIAFAIDHTSKTRAVFEINKGVREGLGVDVNASIPPALRRVPFENMIYIGDGPSDIPVFSIIKERGGKTLGVYAPGSARDYEQAELLLAQERVHAIGPADYRSGQPSSEWIVEAVMANLARLSDAPARAPHEIRHGAVPKHIYKD